MELFLSALAGSLVSTLPIGPINLILMRLALLKQWRRWWACVFGVLLADGFYALMSLKYYQFLNEQISSFAKYSLPILACILMIFGISMLLGKYESGQETFGKTVSGYALFGVFATLIEPALPVFWLSWWTVAHLESPNLTFAGLGLIMGDIIVFGTYGLVGRMCPMPGRTFEKKIGRSLGVALMLISLILFYKWLAGGNHG